MRAASLPEAISDDDRQKNRQNCPCLRNKDSQGQCYSWPGILAGSKVSTPDTLRILFGAQGQFGVLAIVVGSPPGSDAATIKAARDLYFSDARRNQPRQHALNAMKIEHGPPAMTTREPTLAT